MFSSGWNKVCQWGLSYPFKLHWFFVLLTAVVVPFLTRNEKVKMYRGEWYPFSNFPMYSKFEETAYYVYVTDLQDQPVAIYPTFTTWSSAVKKMYDAKIKTIAANLKMPSKSLTAEQVRPAAQAVLAQLRQESRSPEEVRKHPGYRLYAMDVWLEDGRIMKQPRLLGESP